jgi:hypothetical protein
MKLYFLLLMLLLLQTKIQAQGKKVDIVIKDTAYRKVLNYTSDTINNLEILDSVTFHEDVVFEEARFLHYSKFGLARFFKNVNFHDAIFLKEIDFEGAKFSKHSNFFAAKFSEDADFSLVTFSKYVDFSLSIFLKNTYFSQDTISNSLNLTASEFNNRSILYLNQLVFKNNSILIFNDAVLPDTVLFSENNNFSSEISFTNANFTDSNRYDYKKQCPRPIWLYLYNTNISKLHVDYIHFRLLLPDSTIVFPGEEKKIISYDEKASIYEALLSNFKTNGQTNSYKLLDIEYQQFKLNNSWARWITWLPKYWWDFGYDKEYIFVWTVLFVVLFTCFTYFFIYSLNTKVYPIKKIPINKCWSKKLSFEDFINRLWYSFMYTSAIFFMLSLKTENIQFKEKRGTFYLIVVYSFGLLCLAYMANFIVQK